MMISSYKNKKILIVDDQKAFHVMLKTMLSNHGMQNISFIDNAEDAIKLAQREAFDIYLIDYNLGSDKNGSQLINYLRKNKLIPKSALCFIITGDNNKDMVLTALEKSPDDYLIKPFSQTQLFNRLNNALQKKKLLADVFDALEHKEYAKAISLCRDKINTEPKFKGLCENFLAEIFIENKNYPAAEKVLEPLIEQRLLIRTSINLGKTYYLQKKYPEAIQLLSRVIDRSPLQIEAYQWLARSYQEYGYLDDALNILSQAANMTHHSIERHQEVALLANEMQEHEIMISSYQAILQLSRHSFYPDPCHLANYIRSIINYAKKEEDIDERKVILKKVKSTLYQSRFEEGQNKNFDFNSFDEICQGSVLSALGQATKAKRKILNTLNNNERTIPEFDNTVLYESVFSLLDIGESDYAKPYVEELKQRHIIDPTMQASITKQIGESPEDDMQNFKTHNKSGIQAFTAKDYAHALEHFNQALELEPLNSGALLNRVKVYIELLKSEKINNRAILLNNCRNSFELLNNLYLSEKHSQRYLELRNELAALK